MILNDTDCPFCGHDVVTYVSSNRVECEHCEKRWEPGEEVTGEFDWFHQKFKQLERMSVAISTTFKSV